MSLEAHLVFGESTSGWSPTHETNHGDFLEGDRPEGSVIAIRAFDLGVERDFGSSGLPIGAARPREFSCVKQLGPNTPLFLNALARGESFERIYLIVRGPNANGENEEVARYEFEECTLTTTDWDGVQGEEAGASAIAFHYRKLGMRVGANEALVDFS